MKVFDCKRHGLVYSELRAYRAWWVQVGGEDLIHGALVFPLGSQRVRRSGHLGKCSPAT